MNPKKLNKYLYIQKTPTWLVRVFYGLGIIFWLLVAYNFLGAAKVDPFFRWFVAPLIIFFTIYHLCSYGLSMFYKKYDLKKHQSLVRSYWNNFKEPSVDIFLPICGEDMSILQNTWKYVAKLPYKNKRVYVLDDSTKECKEHQRAAEKYGFIYLARRNKGWMKKAGNLRYAFERTDGEFIAIFDADFAPHPDFLKELLPYMSDPKIGIVQSPQYFDMSDETRKKSPIAYGAAHVQEAFYRFIQVARDRFGGTICCGSNAIYRRTALDEIGGTALIEHSEDAHTGFNLLEKGWIVRYVPVILAVGICPDDAHSYFHQQHRWCFGSLSLVLTKKFWSSSVSWKTKFCYLVGLLYYLHHPFAILLSFQLFWTLFFYGHYISLSNGLPYYPYMLWGFVYMLWFPISRFHKGVFYTSFLQLYSYSHAIITALFSSTIGWIPTNTKKIGISSAFRHTIFAVCAYVFAYIVLIAYAVRSGVLHPLNYNYYSIQFWIFYNLILSCVLLWQMYKATLGIRTEQVKNGFLTSAGLTTWQIKTAGLYVLLMAGVFFGIAYL